MHVVTAQCRPSLKVKSSGVSLLPAVVIRCLARRNDGTGDHTDHSVDYESFSRSVPSADETDLLSAPDNQPDADNGTEIISVDGKSPGRCRTLGISRNAWMHVP